MKLKTLDEIIQQIKEEWGDWEAVHGLYDDGLRLIAQQGKPELLKKLDEAVKGATFWYA